MHSLYKSMEVLEASATSLCMQSDCFLHTLHLPQNCVTMHQPVATVATDGDLQFNSAKVT